MLADPCQQSCTDDIRLEKINTRPKTLEDAIQVIGQLVKIIIEQKKGNRFFA